MSGETKHFEAIASHRITKMTVAFGIGLALALYAFHMATDSRIAAQRAEEEGIVHAARGILNRYIEAEGELEIVDPLAPDRAVGKAYIYPSDDGFEVSGHYRRGEADLWHPFLMRLDAESRLIELSVRDDAPDLQRLSAADPKLVVTNW